MFSFSKKIDMVFIDKNDGNILKTLDDAGNPSETIKPINDYINESNPIVSLGKDLNDKGLTFENFSDQDFEQIILFFLTKNLPKEIELSLSKNGIRKLTKFNSFMSSFMGINITNTYSENSFLENLIDKSQLYFTNSEKIKQMIEFIVRNFNQSLKGKHLIKIINSSHNDTIPIVINEFSDMKLFERIDANDFIDVLKEKYQENMPTNYIKELTNIYVLESGSSVLDLEKIKEFVLVFNKENTKDPINLIDFIEVNIEKTKTQEILNRILWSD